MIGSHILENGYPSVEFGSGDRNVLILPGLEDALFAVSNHPLVSRLLLRGFDETGCSVRYLGRKNGLPAGYTTRDMAADIAELVRPETHVIGISLGGMIGQHLAVLSDDVKTLTLCNSGPDDSESARRSMAAALETAENGAWTSTYRTLNDDVDSRIGTAGIELAGHLARAIHDAYETDFLVTGRAAQNHDTWGLLEEIAVPTLLLTGERDTAFPPELLRDAHASLPNSRLEIVDGDHTFFYDSTRQFYRRWRAFVNTIE